MSEPLILGVDIEATDLKADFGTVLTVDLIRIDPTGVMRYKPESFNLYDYKENRGTWVPEGKRLKDGVPLVRTNDDSLLLLDVNKRMAEADILTGWYSKGYDLPFLNTRMLLTGAPPLPPIPHIDLYFTARSNYKLSSNRLAAWQEFLDLEVSKTPLLRKTWRDAGAGDLEALKYVSEHCDKDVLVLRGVYERLKPMIRLHPRVAGPNTGLCRICGGDKFQSRGKVYSGNTKTWKQKALCVTPVQRQGEWGPCNTWNTITLTPTQAESYGYNEGLPT